jgi:hypothetical protein
VRGTGRELRRAGGGLAVAGLLVMCHLAGGTAARGQWEEELIGDRPDFSESTATVGDGRFQLEAGVLYGRDEGESARELGQALLRVGVLPDWEVRIGLGSWLDGPGEAEGWDGGSLGLKVALLENWAARPAVALLVGTSTPWGDSAVADEEWQPEAKVALSWELSDALELAVNTGYARLGADEARFDQAQWSAAVGWGVGDRLGVFGEYFGFSREERDGDATHYLDGGVTWLLSEDLQLDLWGGTNVAGEGADWFVGSGVVARW